MLIVKVGGGEGIPIDAVCQDVRDLTQQGERLILVHGASHETNVLSEALGKPPRFVHLGVGHTEPLHRPRDVDAVLHGPTSAS